MLSSVAHDHWSAINNTATPIESNCMITSHAYRRLFERCCLTPEEARQIVNKALKHGKSISDFSGEKRKFLLKRTREFSTPIVYKGIIFIFNSDCSALLTAYEPSDDFHKSHWTRVRENTEGQYARHHGIPKRRITERTYPRVKSKKKHFNEEYAWYEVIHGWYW